MSNELKEEEDDDEVVDMRLWKIDKLKVDGHYSFGWMAGRRSFFAVIREFKTKVPPMD